MPTIHDFHEEYYSDDSFRSDISEDELKVSAPPTPSSRGSSPSRRPGSAKGRKGAAREKPPSPYLGSAGSRKAKSKSSKPVGSKTPTLKSAREYWLDGLKSGKGGLTGCSKSSNYLGGPKKSQAFSSTSDYLKETVLNMPPRKNSKSRAMVSDPIHRNMKGVPSYKPQEEMYDDIIDLKKQVNALRVENDMVKAKNQRLEDDLMKKERQIDQLLDPTKSDLRMTLNSRQPDSAAKVNSLKQRNLKLEMNLKDKEAELMKLKNDMKGTRMEEMKVAMESFYQEVQRLRYQQSHQTGKATRPGTAEKESTSTAKVKALNGTILRLTESNQRLQSENKLLKQDLERTLYESSAYNGPARSEKSHRDYEDMNRRELLTTVVNLQQKVEHLEGKGMRKDRNLDGEMPGKIPLTGSLSDRLDQLDKRETELLKEKGRLEKDVSRLREDKTKFRQKVEQFEDENKALEKENERLKEQLKSMTPRQNGSMKRHPSSESLHSRRSDRHGDRHSDRYSDRHSDRRSERQDRSGDRQSDRHSERYSDKHGDRHSDRYSDKHGDRQSDRYSDKHSDRHSDRHSDKHSDRLSDRSEKRSRANSSASVRRKQREEEELRERERKLEELRQNRSARTLQKNWRAHKQREQDRNSDLDEAATTIQAAMRGHHRRKDLLDRFNSEPFSPSTTDAASDRIRDEEEEDSDDVDDAAMTIQSAVRGHWSRKEQLSKFSNRSDSEPESARSYRSGKSSKAGSTKSGLDRFMTGSRSGSKAGSSKAGSVRNGSNVSRKDAFSEEDSDDSLVMSTTSKKSTVSKYSNKSGNKGRQSVGSSHSTLKNGLGSKKDNDSDDDDDDLVF
ncbi:IQ domain-containing protein E-like isoform X2 [Lytechinus variegatus]|uniref:IQ domain-containing protein E-like isoform X2 n=1 Tax=Lytechinus variegatus TaxID=7654 RepID=UPI001BB13959|nr:IQ domain-containing protein E-like isoform X2 [Lytechinus variegatus]